MSTPPPAHGKPDLSDYTRPLPPLLGALLVVAVGTGIVFELRGLGFGRGFVAIVVASALVALLIGGFAFAGSYLDQRFHKDVTFRLLGAAIGFGILTIVLFQLAPILLGPGAVVQ
jgi:hypothetical protein